MFQAARVRPASQDCSLEVPYVERSVTLKQLTQKQQMGERSTLNAQYFRLYLPPDTAQMTISLVVTNHHPGEGKQVKGDMYLSWGNLPIQLDLEDYYMWHHDYKAPFGSDQSGVVAKIVLTRALIYGKWGDWFVAIDWSRQVANESFTLSVDYQQECSN